MRLLPRLVAAVVLTATAILLLTTGAQADSGGTLVPTVESWYQPNPSCTLPTGCLTTGTVPVTLPVTVPLTQYPSGTLEVGTKAGTETARSYLKLPFSSLTGTATAATLTVPLDTSTNDGSLDPDTAHALVCEYSGDITAVDGSIDAPPAAACGASAALVYVATPKPHFTANLKPLLAGLLFSDGLVLLPDATAPATDTWQFAFSAHDRTDSAKTDPASVAVTLATDDTTVTVPTEAPTSEPVVPIAPVVDPPLTGVAPPLDAITQPTTPATEPTVQPPVVTTQAPQDSGTAVQTVASTQTFGFAYPVVVLLPIVLLLLVPAVAQSLTRDLTPRDEESDPL